MRVRRRWLGLLMAIALGGCARSCSKTAGPVAAREDLTLAPKESNFIVMANLARMRGTGMWRKLLDVRDSDAEAKRSYDEFVQKCGFDPTKQLDSVFVAFPQRSDNRDFVAVARGTFDEAKLVACAQDQARKDGSSIKVSEYKGHKLYADSKQGGGLQVSVLDRNTVILASPEWMKKALDLAAVPPSGASAKDNAELMALTKRARTSDAVWGVGLVPQSVRDQLKNDPQLSSAASMRDILGSVDFQSGFAADISIDTASELDAKELAARVTAQLLETRKNSQIMMLGLSAFLDGVKAEASGATFRLTIRYNQPQVDDLIGRIRGALRSFGESMGSPGGIPPLPAKP